jgi:hypothetical protein
MNKINKSAEFIYFNFLGGAGKNAVLFKGEYYIIRTKVMGVDLNPDSKKCVLIQVLSTDVRELKRAICPYNRSSAYHKAGSYYKGINLFNKNINPNLRTFKWIEPIYL